LEQDLHEITLQNNEYLKQIKDLHDEMENLRVRLSSTQKKQKKSPAQNSIVSPKVKRLEQQLSEVHNTYSYRLGQAFVSAVARPGKNTFLMPFRFIKIIFDFLFSRKRPSNGSG
jgi:septal ring factor EnvC (AmiA/AmiB activator)